jgi:hypothetical protein
MKQLTLEGKDQFIYKDCPDCKVIIMTRDWKNGSLTIQLCLKHSKLVDPRGDWPLHLSFTHEVSE